jgi:hypothetical protein
MRNGFYTTGLCAVVIAITACTSAVSAEPTRKQVASSPPRAAVAARPRARVFIERRSFLDAGTEVIPGDSRITDYAFPPGYSPIAEALGPGKDYRRQPLLDPWDFPGYSNVWWRRY